MARITVQLVPDGPFTTMDESDLVRTDEVLDNDNELTRVTEYRLRNDPKGRAVHRSVHVHLKKPFVEAAAELGKF